MIGEVMRRHGLTPAHHRPDRLNRSCRPVARKERKRGGHSQAAALRPRPRPVFGGHSRTLALAQAMVGERRHAKRETPSAASRGWP
jgi:hypothetical protein